MKTEGDNVSRERKRFSNSSPTQDALIANRTGNATRHAQFWSLVNELRAEYDLKAG